MKQLILFFLIFLSYNLFSETWELMYKEDFINNELLNCNQIIQKGDSTIIVRFRSDNLIIIYEHSKKEWSYITKSEFWKCLRNDSLYNVYKKSDIYNLFYDSNGNYWFNIPDTLLKITNLFKVTPDSTYIFNKVYVSEINDYVDIMQRPNRTIRNIKEDKNGDIWLCLISRIYQIDSLEYMMLCKFTNSRFESIFISNIFYQFKSKCNFVFDNQNRVWFVNGDTCYIIKDDFVEKKLSTWDSEEGYGYFSEMVFDSKNNFYATNNSLLLFKYDGDTLTTDRRILDIERYITSIGPMYWMRIDSLDNIWITGYNSCNLYKIDTGGVLTTYEVPKFDTTEVEWCYKSLMEIDKDGKIWIPAQSGGLESYGFYIFDPDGIVSVDEKVNSNTPGMPDVKVYTIYPNPADNMVTLEFFIYYDVVDQLEVGIYNIMGMKIKDVTEQIDYDRNRMRANMKFSIADLPRGSYIVSVKAGKTSSYKLLLVGY